MLRDFELFKGLSAQDIEAIEGIVRRQTYERGEIIFHQGDLFEDFFIIETGQIEISIHDAFNKKRILTVLRNFDFFGEMGIFDTKSIRSATAKTLQTTTVLIIPGLAFQALLREKQALSLQLLNTLSKRLRDANLKVASIKMGDAPKEGKIIVSASARNGYGKSTFSSTLSQILVHEAQKSVLFFDLDLYFGEGSYYMGASSGKSIIEFVSRIKDQENPTREAILNLLTRHHERCYSLSAPVTILDAEKVETIQVIKLLKLFRQHFDYVVVDTDSPINEIFLNVLDLADSVFFLVEITSAMDFRNNARYFQALAKLDLPPERISVIASKSNEDEGAIRLQTLFRGELKFNVIGALPKFQGSELEFGKTMFHLAPESPYCIGIRRIVQGIFKEKLEFQKGNQTFLGRLFGVQEQATNLIAGGTSSADEKRTFSIRPAISQDSVASIVRHIKQNLVSGLFDRTREEILDLLEICPDSAIGYEFLGETYMGQKRPAEAIEAFRKALDLDPDNYLALGFWGHLVGKREAFNRGKELVKIHLKQNPDFADFHNDLGKLFFLEADFKKAAECFRKGLEINKDFAEAHLNLAIALGEQKEFSAAINELLRMKDKKLRTYYLLGKFFHELDRFFEAQKSLYFALEFDSNFLDVQTRLDGYRDYFRQIDHLLEKCKEIISHHPEFPDIHVNFGDLLLKIGDREGAKRSYSEALKINPGYGQAKERLENLKRLPEFSIPRPDEETEKKK